MHEPKLIESILRKSTESAETKQRFFAEHAERIVACCHALAKTFDAGGRLFVMGNGGSACDAQHLALEFMHPVIAKRPALPAIALGTSPPLLSAIGNDQDIALGLSKELTMLAAAEDAAIFLSTSGQSSNILRAARVAKERGMLRIAITGRDGGRLAELCDHAFIVSSFSIHRIQETHETLLHVIWDLVHVIRGEEDLVG